jgi:hypothetical protein
MKEIFDIDFVVSHFQTANLKINLDKLKTASTTHLRHFRKSVKYHRKINKTNKAFVNVPNYTSHDAIISAINYELLKRTPIMHSLYKLLFHPRKLVVKAFSGLELMEHNELGALYYKPNNIQNVWHMSHSMVFKNILDFWLKNWKFLITTSLAILVLVVKVIG